MNTHFRLFVPTPSCIAPPVLGSAIVSNREATDSRLVCYYEGNLYGAENMRRYSERVLHAAGRQFARYPTIAFSAYQTDHLIEVGSYDYATKKLTITDRETLQAWLGSEPLAQSEVEGILG